MLFKKYGEISKKELDQVAREATDILSLELLTEAAKQLSFPTNLEKLKKALLNVFDKKSNNKETIREHIRRYYLLKYKMVIFKDEKPVFYYEAILMLGQSSKTYKVTDSYKKHVKKIEKHLKDESELDSIYHKLEHQTKEDVESIKKGALRKAGEDERWYFDTVMTWLGRGQYDQVELMRVFSPNSFKWLFQGRMSFVFSLQENKKIKISIGNHVNPNEALYTLECEVDHFDIYKAINYLIEYGVSVQLSKMESYEAFREFIMRTIIFHIEQFSKYFGQVQRRACIDMVYSSLLTTLKEDASKQDEAVCLNFFRMAGFNKIRKSYLKAELLRAERAQCVDDERWLDETLHSSQAKSQFAAYLLRAEGSFDPMIALFFKEELSDDQLEKVKEKSCDIVMDALRTEPQRERPASNCRLYQFFDLTAYQTSALVQRKRNLKAEIEDVFFLEKQDEASKKAILAEQAQRNDRETFRAAFEVSTTEKKQAIFFDLLKQAKYDEAQDLLERGLYKINEVVQVRNPPKGNDTADVDYRTVLMMAIDDKTITIKTRNDIYLFLCNHGANFISRSGCMSYPKTKYDEVDQRSYTTTYEYEKGSLATRAQEQKNSFYEFLLESVRLGRLEKFLQAMGLFDLSQKDYQKECSVISRLFYEALHDHYRHGHPLPSPLTPFAAVVSIYPLGYLNVIPNVIGGSMSALLSTSANPSVGVVWWLGAADWKVGQRKDDIHERMKGVLSSKLQDNQGRGFPALDQPCAAYQILQFGRTSYEIHPKTNSFVAFSQFYRTMHMTTLDEFKTLSEASLYERIRLHTTESVVEYLMIENRFLFSSLNKKMFKEKDKISDEYPFSLFSFIVYFKVNGCRPGAQDQAWARKCYNLILRKMQGDGYENQLAILSESEIRAHAKQWYRALVQVDKKQYPAGSILDAAIAHSEVHGETPSPLFVILFALRNKNEAWFGLSREMFEKIFLSAMPESKAVTQLLSVIGDAEVKIFKEKLNVILEKIETGHVVEDKPMKESLNKVLEQNELCLATQVLQYGRRSQAIHVETNSYQKFLLFAANHSGLPKPPTNQPAEDPRAQSNHL